MPDEMTHAEFMVAIEEYYGSYETDFKKDIIFKYIYTNFKKEQLPKLFKLLRQNYSSQYKVPPDESVIHNLFNNDDKLEIKALAAWDEYCRKEDPYKDLAIEDVRVYAAIRAMGGHLQLSNRLKADEVWTKKRFVELYKLYSKNPPDFKPTIMRGLTQIKNDTIVMIGNPENCMKLIEEYKSCKNELIENLTKNIKRIGEG